MTDALPEAVTDLHRELRKAMLDRFKNQRELAGATGLSADTISRAFKGVPTPDTLDRILTACGKPVLRDGRYDDSWPKLHYLASASMRQWGARPSGTTAAPAPLTFTDFMIERTRDFTGRVWAIDRIDSIMAEPAFPSGYVLVHGEPGSGKSTLLSHLVRERDYPHHFNSPSVSSAERFYANTFTQLAARYGLAYEPVPSDPADRLQRLLAMLTAVVRSGRRLTLVLDALDENEQADGGLLPDGLPAGVHVIVSSRDRKSYGLPPGFRPLRIGGLDPQNRQDIEDYIARILEQHRAEFAPRIAQWPVGEAEFVRVLTEHSTGNFMYVVHVLRDLRTGELTLDTSDKIDHLPFGLREYYEKHWKTMQQQDAATMRDVYDPVLRVLAAADKPVDREFLIEHSGRTDGQVNQVLRTWFPFLAETRPETGPRLYSFYHASFRDFLAEDAIGLSGTLKRMNAYRMSLIPGYPG